MSDSISFFSSDKELDLSSKFDSAKSGYRYAEKNKMNLVVDTKLTDKVRDYFFKINPELDQSDKHRNYGFAYFLSMRQVVDFQKKAFNGALFEDYLLNKGVFLMDVGKINTYYSSMLVQQSYEKSTFYKNSEYFVNLAHKIIYEIDQGKNVFIVSEI